MVRRTWTLVAVFLATLAFVHAADSLLSPCPDLNGTRSHPTDVCLANGAIVTRVRATSSNDLCVSGQNIPSSRACLSTSTSDLSHNRIQDIPCTSPRMSLSATQPMTLNLSGNLINGSALLCLPSTVETLDLSYNRLTQIPLEFFLPLPWNLQSLKINGNDIRSIYIGRLPSTLTHLDLSENPRIQSIVVSAGVYALLTHPKFALKVGPFTAPKKPTESGCLQPPPRLQGIYVCVLVAPGTDSEDMLHTILGLMYQVVIPAIAFVLAGYLVKLAIMWSREQRELRAMGESRQTYLSSIYSEFRSPIQYRCSVDIASSPLESPQQDEVMDFRI
ncbi:Aste57867_17623 [Aphanomyces stellatus]|uniref:Aste57867_17623 protein n=1 Tax=Aphanomyces stellatus TaxID=120398 RepID=A0A485L8D6_9STRA|nr:hypothetical protein As57867_017563 [Aphanomyces stellatus]VFT94374.1 Aste57867_17623 [Aphanomyces stellatus]